MQNGCALYKREFVSSDGKIINNISNRAFVELIYISFDKNRENFNLFAHPNKKYINILKNSIILK